MDENNPDNVERQINIDNQQNVERQVDVGKVINVNELLAANDDTTRLTESSAGEEVLPPISQTQGNFDAAIIFGPDEHYENWRMTAEFLTPNIFEEGPKTGDSKVTHNESAIAETFSKLKTLGKPINVLYILSHGETSSFVKTSNPYDKLLEKIEVACKPLGPNAPQTIQFLTCNVGFSPMNLAKLGKVTGAMTVRAPATIVVFGRKGLIINGIDTAKLDRNKAVAMVNKYKDENLFEILKQNGVERFYKYIPGLPHPGPTASEEILSALASVFHKFGLIAHVSIEKSPSSPTGENALSYWEMQTITLDPNKEIDLETEGADFSIATKYKMIEVDVRQYKPKE
jgi:hypothetical protein